MPAAGLKSAHSGEMPFQRDGCYFLHKEANYDTEGLTPLALLWKDPECSQYFIDTDASGVVPQYQNLILQYAENGTVCTADDPPVSLGQLPTDFTASSPASLRSGFLLSVSYSETLLISMLSLKDSESA